VELESLINAKSGACPEDCAFCSQSARFETGVDVFAFLDLDEVVAAARSTREAGATQFCIVVAVRGPEERLLRKVLEAVDAVHRETGLEVACSLGLLTREQAERLAAAGVRRYNHNLETCREVFPSICTTHTWDDRVATARLAGEVGMELCCGGILGMGETRAARAELLAQLAALDPQPESVPINALVPIPGTPLEHAEPLDWTELVRAVAAARILMPRAVVRLSAGRTEMSEAAQALCFLAGANSIFVGEELLTTPNPDPQSDAALFAKLGLEAARGAR
jgi:biotin synthase